MENLPIFFVIIMTAIIILDLAKRINLMHPAFLFLYLFIAPFPIFLVTWCKENQFFIISLCLFLFYYWARIFFFPIRKKKIPNLRLRIMMGGRIITLFTMMETLAIPFVAFFTYPYWSNMFTPILLSTQIIFTILFTVTLFLNGMLRMFFTSRRLSILRRIVMFCTMWIPIVNIPVLLYVCRLVALEYDFACYKQDLHLTRASSDICKTKYPLVMVHGILFRDLKYFNYWGRIPRELMKYGATIYYGNQEAIGTIVYNAEDIKKTILQVMRETGCDKVNILAHSKGGLDSRYAISQLGIAEHVASLTTMNTPHHGCRFVDRACQLPDWLYHFIAKIFNSVFRKLGDQNPDFYTATRQFSTTWSAEFNRTIPNASNVYYQSYGSIMKNAFSDFILTIPYLIVKAFSGSNDGLVSIDSAKWGEYKGLFQSGGRRGISHGDMIDLKRDDYKGFDVCETYVQIVSQLKEMGF